MHSYVLSIPLMPIKAIDGMYGVQVYNASQGFDAAQSSQGPYKAPALHPNHQVNTYLCIGSRIYIHMELRG